MAEDKGLDINKIKGTGGNHRITKLDIQRVEKMDTTMLVIRHLMKIQVVMFQHRLWIQVRLVKD